MSTFYELGLSEKLVKATVEMGFEETTPIQELTIPLLMQGRDVIGQAQTGTGKTAAFGIPLIESIEVEPVIKGLVVTPTRELAVQVAEEINRIGQFKGVRALPVYGGQDINRQIRALKNKPQIIVGTPGRLIDHIRRKTVRLQNVTMVVIDEADEMLNMGFIEDIETILQELPEERQTLLFSATMPKPVKLLAQSFMNNPELVSVKTKEVTVPSIEQIYYEVMDKLKFDVLCRLLDIQSPELAIVFCRTKRRVDEVYEALNKRGYLAEALHGDLTQTKRNSVLKNFKEGETEILVATDVAARGLDINGVTHVYNFDIPQDAESYVHRIGRTGRAGKKGMAITFVTPREISHLRTIEQVTKRKILRQPIPTVKEAVEGQRKLTVDKLMNAVDEGDFSHYRELAESLLEGIDSVTLLSAALKLLTKESNATSVKLFDEAKPSAQKTWTGNRTGKSRRPVGKGNSSKGSSSKGNSSKGNSSKGNWPNKKKPRQ